MSNGGVWDFPSPDIMQEVQVKAIGASAEFHSFQGGVVNIVTKSGSNDYRGMFSAYVIPGDWVGQQHAERALPLHGALQPAGHAASWAAASSATACGSTPSCRPRGRRRPASASIRIWSAPAARTTSRSSKLTGRLFENGNLSVGWNNNMFCCAATASRTAPLITQTVEHGHNPVVYSQYTQTLGNATLIEVRGGGIYIRDNFTPYSERLRDLRPHRPGHRHQLSVNGQTASKQFHNRTTLDASIAHTTSALGPGSHDFKTGIQTAYATQRTVLARIGGVSYTDLNGAPYRATYNDPPATGGRIRSLGAYLQDTWTLNDRLTLNLGLRFDATRGDVPGDDARRPRSRASTARRSRRRSCATTASPTSSRSTPSRRASASRSGSTSRDAPCSSRPTVASTASW